MNMSKEEAAMFLKEVVVYDTKWSKEKKDAEDERRNMTRTPANFAKGDRVYTIGRLPAHGHGKGKVYFVGRYRSLIIWNTGADEWMMNDKVAKGKRPKAARTEIIRQLVNAPLVDGVTGELSERGTKG